MLDGATVKRFRSGTDRSVPPAETLQRLAALLPAVGITRVANVTGLDRIGLPVVMVCRPNGRMLSVSQGKGLDLVAAKVSGIMESIESYHAERIMQPLVLASQREMEMRHKLADVGRLPQRRPHAAHRPLLWIAGIDLVLGSSRWVPYEMVHTNYTADPLLLPRCFAATTNGLAAGNQLAEAVSHGLCELVERDAVSHWKRLPDSEQDLGRIDAGTVDCPHCRHAIEKLQHARVEFGIWELRSRFGIPVFLCRVAEAAEQWGRRLPPAEGSGCHPNRDIALLRALTEVAQSRLTDISGARDDRFRSDYLHLLAEENRSLALQRLARPCTTIACAACPSFDADIYEDEIGWMVSRLTGAGIRQVIVVNLTRDDLKLPVVRAVVPGLAYPELRPHEAAS